MEKPTPHYIKGFNHSFFLAKHKPNLIEVILKTSSTNDFIRGLEDGQKTYNLEMSKSKRLGEIDKLRYKKSLNKGLER